MMQLPENFQSAVHELEKLPSVGGKSATRMVLSMLQWPQAKVDEFLTGIKKLSELKTCIQCSMISDDSICTICTNPKRNQDKMCVVESITDLMAIERSHHFDGIYHVLGGVLNPLAGIGPNELKLDQVFNRINSKACKEVILAINPSVEGDATCSYIKQNLSSETQVQRIGFGVPIGGSLEYLDPLTISKALENRKEL